MAYPLGLDIAKRAFGIRTTTDTLSGVGVPWSPVIDLRVMKRSIRNVFLQPSLFS